MLNKRVNNHLSFSSFFSHLILTHSAGSRINPDFSMYCSKGQIISHKSYLTTKLWICCYAKHSVATPKNTTQHGVRPHAMQFGPHSCQRKEGCIHHITQFTGIRKQSSGSSYPTIKGAAFVIDEPDRTGKKILNFSTIRS
jgi:hypothetical protein